MGTPVSDLFVATLAITLAERSGVTVEVGGAADGRGGAGVALDKVLVGVPGCVCVAAAVPVTVAVPVNASAGVKLGWGVVVPVSGETVLTGVSVGVSEPDG